MKAFVFEKYGPPLSNHQLKKVEKPTPKDHEVLVKIHSASINDWDWGLIRGHPFVIKMINGLSKPKAKIPGVDIAGTVEAIGKNVNKLKVGDEVYGDLSESGFGAFAEYVCTKENSLARKPQNISFAEAAALPHAALLALQGLVDEGHITTGQKILINGAGGGVGTIGIQITQLFDAVVTGIDSESKLELMRTLGYKKAIDYIKEDFTKSGEKYDLILDTKTNRSAYKYARCLKPNGRYITVGGSISRLIQILLAGALRSIFSNKKLKVLRLKPNKNLNLITEWVEKEKIKPHIDGPHPFEDIPRLVQYFGEGKHKGKVVAKMPGT